MIYTMEEIRQRVIPIAEKYDLNAVYLFGSYARNEATEHSDVDILIDRAGSKVKSMFEMGGLYEDLCKSIPKEIDLVTEQTLEQPSTRQRTPLFVENVHAERIRLV
ncbi:MAG: nucleotidyltransferase domain-containing protein [Oscillospiraceae bacterium]|nr:nucleotidyltransferase domain-containing protein [Oscillospiraceae bacterium]